MADNWEWVAELADGTRLAERVVQTFKAVDAGRCVAVELVPRRLFGKPVRVRVDPKRGQRAVCFRRRRVTVRFDGSARTPQPPLTVAGFEGPGGSAYLVALDDGTVLLTDDLSSL